MPPHDRRAGRILRWCGVAAVVVLWSSMSFALVRTGLGVSGDRPLSELGTLDAGRWLFSGGLLVAAALLAAFTLVVARRHRTGPAFVVVSLVGLVGQAVVALVPLDGAGAADEVHVGAGLVLGASLPLVMALHARALPGDGRRRRVAMALAGLSVIASLVGVALSGQQRAALAEVVPASAYHLWILVVSGWLGRRVGRAGSG